MAQAYKRLERVLKLEAEQGFQNQAVIGGIRQFATFWVSKAREDATDEGDLAFVEQVAEVLMAYDRLPGVEARAKALRSIQDRLRDRQQRPASPADAPQPVPAEPKRPPVSRRTEPIRRRSSPPKEPVPEGRQSPEPAPAPAPDVADPAGLNQPTHVLKGVGPVMAQKLEKLGAHTILDLLYVFPRRYDDYTLMKPIGQVQYGEQVTVIGTIWETRARRTRGNQVIVQSTISDGTGSIQATWFNQPWLANKLKAGLQVVVSGKVEQFLGRNVFQSPEWEPLAIEPLKTRRIVPVYPLTEGLSGNKMREVLRTAVQTWSGRVADPLPDSIRQRLNLYNLPQSIEQTHFPETHEALHQARKRLVFDELLLLQLGMLGKRRDWQTEPAFPIQIAPGILIQYYRTLPFHLTDAQRRVIDEIVADMARPVPMNRLLQGDVGAGKTVVAATAMLAAVRANTQAALMAPTEILAEQHFRGLQQLLAPMDINMRLLTGSTSAADKHEVYAGLAAGTIQLVVGTHALIQEAVTFDKLGIAVIDEQHRFGVSQRGALRQKGSQTADGQTNPHLLVMSATPIPRTLALSLYGDLDLSILDEMPPGRQEIKTRWLRSHERERAYAFVRGQVRNGRQAYIIYPLVEESEKIDARAAVSEYERLRKEVFPDLELGLIHGRMRSEEKESTMRGFHDGQIDILVATSVIEVGVDIPNSTVIVIDGANRFGLAQLHQFRGRVGRSEHQSYCLLIAESGSAESEERLQALEQSNDGFLLAEKDLEIRGPGEFFGQRQSGLPELRLASLLDMEMLAVARDEAQAIFAEDPLLEAPDHHLLRQQVASFWERAGDVS